MYYIPSGLDGKARAGEVPGACWLGVLGVWRGVPGVPSINRVKYFEILFTTRLIDILSYNSND